jgi:hypothetical protein
MRTQILKAIDTVGRMDEISLRLSDIVECKTVIDDSYDIIESVVVHCKNDVAMFEFNIQVDMFADSFEVRVAEVEGSPYSCDNFMIILDREYNIIAN